MFNDKSKTILLVEDNPDDVDLTLRAFNKNNIMNTVVVAKDGAEALDYLFCTGKYHDRDREDMPQIILLDLNLPKVNGLKVLQKIREDKHTQLLPVIILTSSKEQQDLLDSYSLGANSYVRKPIDFDQFSECIRQLGLYWLVLNIGPTRE